MRFHLQVVRETHSDVRKGEEAPALYRAESVDGVILRIQRDEWTTWKVRQLDGGMTAGAVVRVVLCLGAAFGLVLLAAPKFKQLYRQEIRLSRRVRCRQ